MCPALDRREAVQENQGHRGEVWGPWGNRRSPAEEASGEEGQDQQLGKIKISKSHIEHRNRVRNTEFESLLIVKSVNSAFESHRCR